MGDSQSSRADLQFQSFAERCGRGERPSIEETLRDLTPEESSEILASLIACEVAARRLAGETVEQHEFQRRFPQMARAIDSVFEMAPGELYATLSGKRVDPTALEHRTIPGSSEDGAAQAPEGEEAGPEPHETTVNALAFQPTAMHISPLDSDSPTGAARDQAGAADAAGEADATLASDSGTPGADGRPRRAGAVHLIGDYEVLGVLGRGGMGQVYRARQRRADRIVALKVVRADQFDDPQLIERFKAEARAAARIDHDHLVTIYEVGEVAGQHFFSMKLVDGESLQDKLKRGPLAPSDAARYIAQVCRAVAAAHQKGVLHRDIKPGNILVERESDKALVTDFGLAKLQTEQAEDSRLMTHAGAIFGTPAYMSPEQAADASHVTEAADTYSLGATLYHLLTGRPVFQGKSLHETLRMAAESLPLPPRKLAPQLPRDLDTICLKALEKEPRRRLAVAEMAEELERHLRGEPIRSRKITRVERAARWCRRNKLWTGLAVTVATLIAVAFIAAALASRANRLRAANELADQILQRREAVERVLAQPRLGPEFVASLSDRLLELARLNESQSATASERVKSELTKFLRAQIMRPKLENTEQIAETLNAAASLLGDDAAALRRELQARQQAWNELASLDLTRAETFFDAPVKRSEQGLRRRLPPQEVPGSAPAVGAASPYVLSALRCPTEGAWGEAEFEDWDRAWEIGLLLDSKVEGGRSTGYQFLLRSGGPRGESFAARRADNRQFLVRIRRDGRTQQRFYLDSADLPPGPLRLRASRQGVRLEFQVNDLPPMVYEELFASSFQEGVFGLSWPPLTTLRGFRTRQRMLAESTSPLELGDQLFAEEKFEAALEQYGAQAVSAADPAFRDEARFKQAISLIRLQRVADAESALGELAVGERGKWALLAVCQLWLLYLETDRFDDAAALLTVAESRYTIEELVEAAPEPVRAKIIDAYRDSASGNPYRDFRPDPQRLAKLQRAATVQQLLSNDLDDLVDVRMDLMRALWQNDQLEESVSICEEILDEPAVGRFNRRRALDYYAWLMTVAGEPQKAIDKINSTIFIDQTNISGYYVNSLLARAQLEAKLEQWEAAEKTLSLYLKGAEQLNEEPRLDAYLLGGFLLQETGREEQGREFWKQGYELARKRDEYIVLTASILGSVSQLIGPADIDKMLRRVTSANQGSTALAFMAKGLIPERLLYNVPQNMWRNRRGREWARRMALRDVSLGESVYTQVMLTAYETWRLVVTGVEDLSVELSDEQDAVIWDLVQTHYRRYVEGATNELQAVQIMQTYNGVTGVFGWAGVAAKLDPQLLHPIAYAFACHFRHIQRWDDARKFLDVAAKTADPRLKKLVAEEAAQQRARERPAKSPEAPPPVD